MSAAHRHHFDPIAAVLRPEDELSYEGAGSIELESLLEKTKQIRDQSNGLCPKANVYVIGADNDLCTAVKTFLNDGFHVHTCTTAGEFLAHPIVDAPGCILLDLELPGLSGLQLQGILARRANPLPIIFISAHVEIPTVVRAIKAGAIDFLIKPIDQEVLFDTINRALTFFHQQHHHRQQVAKWKAAFDLLSHREAQVFDLVAAGKMNKEIASDLGITLRTVKAHRGHVMTKMRISSVAELVHIADWLEASNSVTRPSL